MGRTKVAEMKARKRMVKNHPERPSFIGIILFLFVVALLIVACYYASKFNMYMRTIEVEY